MGVWIWAVIPLVAIIGSFYIEHQKLKMKMMEKGEQSQQEVDEVRKLVNSLKTRIENLEAIAAGEPESFKTGAGTGMKEIEIEEADPKKENRQTVSNIAKKQRG